MPEYVIYMQKILCIELNRQNINKVYKKTQYKKYLQC